MKYEVKITNPALFSNIIVDASDLRGSETTAEGDLAIYHGNGFDQHVSGEMGLNDFEEEFGFVLVPLEN